MTEFVAGSAVILRPSVSATTVDIEPAPVSLEIPVLDSPSPPRLVVADPKPPVDPVALVLCG